jgi:hypothetical protein
MGPIDQDPAPVSPGYPTRRLPSDAELAARLAAWYRLWDELLTTCLNSEEADLLVDEARRNDAASGRPAA